MATNGRYTMETIKRIFKEEGVEDAWNTIARVAQKYGWRVNLMAAVDVIDNGNHLDYRMWHAGVHSHSFDASRRELLDAYAKKYGIGDNLVSPEAQAAVLSGDDEALRSIANFDAAKMADMGFRSFEAVEWKAGRAKVVPTGELYDAISLIAHGDFSEAELESITELLGDLKRARIQGNMGNLMAGLMSGRIKPEELQGKLASLLGAGAASRPVKEEPGKPAFVEIIEDGQVTGFRDEATGQEYRFGEEE